MKQLSDLGCKVEIYKGYVFEERAVDLSGGIDFLTWAKSSVYDPLLLKQLKLLANSVYGTFAFRKRRYSLNYDTNYRGFYHNAGEAAFSSYNCYTNKGLSKINFNVLKTETQEYPNSVVTYSNIAANNRINLRNKLLKLKEAYKELKFYQINIDSISVNIDLGLQGAELGEFKFVKKERLIFFAPQFYLNIDGRYFLINNKKIDNFCEVKRKVREYSLNNQAKFYQYYKVFNPSTSKFELPVVGYLNNLVEDLDMISTKRKSRLEIKPKTLSILEPHIQDLSSSIFAIMREIRQKTKDTAMYYSLDFEAYHIGQNQITSTVRVNIPVTALLEGSSAQIKFLLKINAIYNNWCYKYDADTYDTTISLNIYDSNKLFINNIQLL